LKVTLEDLVEQVRTAGASDLILTAGAVPQLRVNGLLCPGGAEVLRAEDTRGMAESLMNPAQRKLFREVKNIDLSKEFRGGLRFRINIYVQKDAVAIAIRNIPATIPSFAMLGLPALAKDFALQPHGLVLITGPAGSGKSTTLAAMIDFINQTRHLHVVCLEDPIEYVHAHRLSVIDQREIGTDARSFQEALRGVFRQSPDVIMVGEMRDLETVQLVLTLAETGHLILATLHTQDTSHAINRMVDIFPAGQQDQIYMQLSQVLIGVIAQQLIISSDRQRRILAYEILRVNHAVRNLIRERQIQQIYSVVETSQSEGMVTMNETLRRLHDQKLIGFDEALSRSPRPKEFMRSTARAGKRELKTGAEQA
jgi:twitching motility protein PilT